MTNKSNNKKSVFKKRLHKGFKKFYKLLKKFTPIVVSIVSVIIAYETVKTSQFSSINSLLVEKYKTDLEHLEEDVLSLQNMQAEVDLDNKAELGSLETLKYYKSRNKAIKNSAELYLNEENKNCDSLQDKIKEECEKLDSDLDIAISYRKAHPPKTEQKPHIRVPLVKTDGPGVNADKIEVADNKDLMKEYIKYSKEEWSDLPMRVKTYIDNFDKKNYKDK